MPGWGGIISILVKTASTPLTSASASINLICPGESTDLTASGGTDGTGTQIAWYDGPGGTGNQLGTGSGITVSPSTTTTYYARREGDYNVTTDVSVVVTLEDNNPDADADGIGDACDDEFNIDVIVDSTFTYIEDLGLTNGQTNALTGKLQNALDKYCDGNVNQALNKLNAFLNQVQGQEAGGVLTAAETAFLTAAANAMIDAINGATSTPPHSYY